MPAPATSRAQLGAVLGAAHPGPATAVTVLTALLAVSAGHGWRSGALVVLAVAAGQLSIGWSNDLLDAARDRAVGRRDKPLARGAVTDQVVRRLVAGALVACVLLSWACGWRSAVVHLGLGVASGWAYNLGLKRTAWSALPYAVAFGALPAVVWLALPHPVEPPAWMLLTGALLGVGAHLLNALPDLADDLATGVRGLPQRLGARVVRVTAPLVLLAGTGVAVLGPGGRGGSGGSGGCGGWGGSVPGSAWAAGAAALVLAVVAMTGRGRVPFLASVGIALVNVVSLVLRG